MSNFQSQYTGQQIDEAIGKALTGGADGLTPYIKDGYWWIGEENTGVKAQGDPYVLTEADKTAIAREVLNSLPYYDGTVEDVGGVELISFTIDGTSYQAESGMTWGEWCESSYNTDGYYTVGSGTDLICNSSGRTVIGSNGAVRPYTEIISNANYSTGGNSPTPV